MIRLPKWTELHPGMAITDPGNARENRTGDWRSLVPLTNREQCIRCAVCYIYCPDAAIAIKPDGYMAVDLNYCKGCGICARECITGCIRMKEQEE